MLTYYIQKIVNKMKEILIYAYLPCVAASAHLGGDGDGNVDGSWWDLSKPTHDAWSLNRLMSEFELHGKFWSLGPKLAYFNEACIKLRKILWQFLWGRLLPSCLAYLISSLFVCTWSRVLTNLVLSHVLSHTRTIFILTAIPTPSYPSWCPPQHARVRKSTLCMEILRRIK